ncbi:MAG: rhomboid family intramembrane serine protease [Zhongshania sp.]|uniref:rhomboid family intramembrane serine protease n=1 Tax=Zhongshania sp. TaxID=1971902 RepID=UPI00261D1FBC|nr:rhomboid family intramembrane serine protease [Zhongshania sp.]MDF1693977.1 rhomboid family intramembrane serine protease [Zhongshania sp.]
MSEYIGLRLPLTANLEKFSALLWQLSLPHRIAEEKGMLVLWVGSTAHVEQVKELYQRLESGELQLSEAPQPIAVKKTGGWYRNLAAVPVVVALLLLSLAGSILPYLDRQFEILPLFSFYQLHVVGGELQGDWPKGQLWRLITPAFLHFGLMHIVFNSLWLWELGGMIERRQGAVRILGLVLLIAAGSNIAQAMTGVSLFGGMSGVIYGLLGYIVVWNRLRPATPFPLVNGVAVVMVVWLLVCMAGFTELLGLGAVANTAHLSGLVLGLILGLAAALLDRKPV